MQRWIPVEMIDSASIETTRTSNYTMDLSNSRSTSISRRTIAAYFVAFFQKKFGQITSVLSTEKKRIRPMEFASWLTCPVMPVINATWRFFASLATGSLVSLAISTTKAFWIDSMSLISSKCNSRTQGWRQWECEQKQIFCQACAYVWKREG